jgi:hypothetical protein
MTIDIITTRQPNAQTAAADLIRLDTFFWLQYIPRVFVYLSYYIAMRKTDDHGLSLNLLHRKMGLEAKDCVSRIKMTMGNI